MKPNFALSLSHDGIALLHRTAAGWSSVGAMSLGDPDSAATLEVLRDTARGLEPHGVASKLILPQSEVLITRIHAPGPDPEDIERQVRAAVDGLTPYGVDELAIDWHGTPPEIHVALVAREILEQAESFAQDHGFEPVRFVAEGSDSGFAREIDFGSTRHARSVAASYGTGAATPTGSGTAPFDPTDSPRDADPVAGKSTRESTGKRHSKSRRAKAASSRQTTGPDPAGTPPAPDRAAPAQPADPVTTPAPDESKPQAVGASDAATPPVAFASRRARGQRKPDRQEATKQGPGNETGSGAGSDRKRGLRTRLRRLLRSMAPAAPADGPAAAAPRSDTRQAPKSLSQRFATERKATSPPDRAKGAPGAMEPARQRQDRAPPVPARAQRVEVPAAAASGTGVVELERPPDARQPAPPPPARERGTELRGAELRAALAAPVPDLSRKGRNGSAADTKLQDESSEAQRLTVFGAREGTDKTAGGFARRGLTLTASLLLLLAAVALWAFYFAAPRDAGEGASSGAQPSGTALVAPRDSGSEPAPATDIGLSTPAPEGSDALPSLSEPTLSDTGEALPDETGLPERGTDDGLRAEAPVSDSGLASTDLANTDLANTDLANTDLGGAQPGSAASGLIDDTPAAAATQDPFPATTALPAPGVPAPGGVQAGNAALPIVPAPPAPFGTDPGILAAPGAAGGGAPAVDSPNGTVPPTETEIAAPDTPVTDPADAAVAPDELATAAQPDADLQDAPTPADSLPPEERDLDIAVIEGTPPVLPGTRPFVPVDIPPVGATPDDVATAEVLAMERGQELFDTPETQPGTRPLARPASIEGVTQTAPAETAPDAPAAEPGTVPAEVAPQDGATDIAPLEDAALPAALQPQADIPPGGIALSALRPAARPVEVEAAAAMQSAQPEADIQSDSPLAVAASLRPTQRPSGFGTQVQRALAAAQRTPAAPQPDAQVQQASAAAAPAVTRAAPAIPTSASVAREATQTSAINLRRINLIGVFGSAGNRNALVRLSNGNVVRVGVGDRLDGGQVAAIAESELRYVKNGRTHALQIGESG